MKTATQDIRDAFARRDVDALGRALAMLERTEQIREAEIRRLRGGSRSPKRLRLGHADRP